ncbi:MAG TPA: alpha/beta fold hydrolase [Bacilli bacterium]|nr:MAG: 2-hydroxy-6-oxo-6-(2'-aminophenyl)hexa-2,4-dienoic acid hydrolase [Tenericutes bacterium ADurb.BinA124]HPN61289.1 alpha/beta fold hydrolase [Bacilli bacterium]HPX84913.1 alpha/beta fold hydrolase [Bacilli bacterium]HQC74894.1 alpha/beta fold hydrolase [Bacilli bacterium]
MLRHLEINNHEGKTLRGYLTTPDRPFSLTVVFFHGFTGNKTEHGHLFRDFSRELATKGIASLRMDFSGNGESDGVFADFTFQTMMQEAQVMVDFARSLSPQVAVLGFSMGGAVAAQMAVNNVKHIKTLVLWSPAGNINSLVQKRYETTKKLPNGNADILGFEISEALYQSTFVYDWYRDLSQYPHPVFIIHGQADLSVPWEFGKKFADLFPKAQFQLFPNANHGYDNRLDQQLLKEKTLQFLLGDKI